MAPTETEEDIQKRIDSLRLKPNLSTPTPNYGKILVNDDVDKALENGKSPQVVWFRTVWDRLLPESCYNPNHSVVIASPMAEADFEINCLPNKCRRTWYQTILQVNRLTVYKTNPN